MDEGKSQKFLSTADNKDNKLYFQLKLQLFLVNIQYFKLLITTFILALVITDNTRLSCWRLKGILIDCKKCSHSLRLTAGFRSFMRRKRFYKFLIWREKFNAKMFYSLFRFWVHCIKFSFLLRWFQWAPLSLFPFGVIFELRIRRWINIVQEPASAVINCENKTKKLSPGSWISCSATNALAYVKSPIAPS